MLRIPDLDRLVADGFLAQEQRDRIVAHYKLRKHHNPMLVIVSVLGGLLVGLGLILLIGSNWDEIPRAVKLLVGAGLMCGLHYAGWRLRSGTEASPKTAEALHLGGSLMWMGNIALVGQIYNLSSRPPNAILLFVLGIAPLPFLLRSMPQFLLLLTGFSVWLGFEICEPGSWIMLSDPSFRLLFYAIVGLMLLGLGGTLRKTSNRSFGPPTELLGVTMFQIGAYPLTLRDFDRYLASHTMSFPLLFLIGSVIAVGLNLLAREQKTGNWLRLGGVGGGLALVCGCVAWSLSSPLPQDYWEHNLSFPIHYVASLGLFCLTLAQIQGGVRIRSAALVNLGIAALALQIVTIYFQLLGSMLQTGLVFIVSGLFLIFLTVVLERRRRKLLARMRQDDGDTTTTDADEPAAPAPSVAGSGTAPSQAPGI